MCSPMPDIDIDDLEDPPPCGMYPECDHAQWCEWPRCLETKDDRPTE